MILFACCCGSSSIDVVQPVFYLLSKTPQESTIQYFCRKFEDYDFSYQALAIREIFKKRDDKKLVKDTFRILFSPNPLASRSPFSLAKITSEGIVAVLSILSRISSEAADRYIPEIHKEIRRNSEYEYTGEAISRIIFLWDQRERAFNAKRKNNLECART